MFTTRLQRQAAQSRSPVSSHPVAWDLWIFGSADPSGPSGRAVRGGDPWRFAPRAPCFAPGVWFQPASQCGKPKNSPILSPEMDAIRCHKPSINEGLWPSWVYHIRSKTIQSCPGKKHQWCMDNLPCCEMIRNDMNFVRDTDPHYKYHTTNTYIQGFPYRYIIHDFQKKWSRVVACPPYPPSRSRRLKAQRLHRDSSCVPKEKKHNLSSSVSESCPTSFLGYITSFLSDLYAIATNKMNASWIWFFQIITCGNQLPIWSCFWWLNGPQLFGENLTTYPSFVSNLGR